MKLRSGRALLLLLLCLTVAAGCSSGTEPVAREPPPLSSLLSTQQASPRSSPDATGVRRAVAAYVAALNVALRTGDTSQARTLSTAACTCREQLKRIADLYRANGRFVGARVDVVSIRTGTVAAGSANATLTYNSPPSKVVNGKGEARSVAARSNQKVAVVLTKSAGRWLVASMTTPRR